MRTKELAHPLLGPLFGRAPAGVLPHVGKPRIDGKRVRWRLSRLLVARRLPVTTPQMRAATGFEHKEIGAALAKWFGLAMCGCMTTSMGS